MARAETPCGISPRRRSQPPPGASARADAEDAPRSENRSRTEPELRHAPRQFRGADRFPFGVQKQQRTPTTALAPRLCCRGEPRARSCWTLTTMEAGARPRSRGSASGSRFIAEGQHRARMAIRLIATYELVDREEKYVGTVRLPVVGFSEPDKDGRERPRVLLLSGDDPYIVDFHPESSVETPYGTLQAFVIDAVSDPIPAQPGWVADMWAGRIGPEESRRLGTFPVLAWRPSRRRAGMTIRRGMPSCWCPSVMTRSAATRVRSAP